MSPDLLREPPAKGTGGSDKVLGGELAGGGSCRLPQRWRKGENVEVQEHCERRTCLAVLCWAEWPYVSPLPQVSREIPNGTDHARWCRPLYQITNV